MSEGWAMNTWVIRKKLEIKDAIRYSSSVRHIYRYLLFAKAHFTSDPMLRLIRLVDSVRYVCNPGDDRLINKFIHAQLDKKMPSIDEINTYYRKKYFNDLDHKELQNWNVFNFII